MQVSMEKKLLGFLALNLVILIVVFFDSTAMNFFHGLTQSFYGGNAAIKTLLVLLALSASSALSVYVVKSGKTPSSKHAGNFLLAMCFIGAVGLAAGVIQLHFFSFELDTNHPIATINNDMTNWEATSLYHNHLPKGAVYFLTKPLGLKFPGFDAGQPLYELQKNGLLYS